MKKMILLLTLLLSGIICFAQLEVNIPFDTNVVGQPWDETNYTFQSDYFYVTNVGETAEFTISVSSFDLPEGWNLMWCHEIEGEGGCNVSPSLTIDFPQNAEVKLDFIISPVASAGSCHIVFEFTSETLPEPEVIMFFFQTEDASNADDMNLAQPAVQLFQNYPNPFNPTTTIRFSVDKKAPVNLTIYNATGQKVQTLADFNASAGDYERIWNGKDELGNNVTSGTYFYKLTSGKYISHKKMILMK